MNNTVRLIQDRIAGQVPGIKYVDADWGQLDAEEPSVKWPCALVDIESADCEQMESGGTSQRVLCEIRVTVESLHLAPTNRASADGMRQQGLEFYAILDDVYEALQGWDMGAGYGRLEHLRTRTRNVQRGRMRKDMYYSLVYYR